MHLTTQHIEFIDTYLKHSGVEYVDIRFEMTDHIATALEAQEGDFLEQFRLYMAREKKYLMQNNRNFAKQARRRAFKVLLQGMLKPSFLLIVLVAFFTCKVFMSGWAGDAVREVLGIAYLIILLSAGIYFQFTFRKNRSKFSVADKFISILLVANYIVFIAFRPEKVLGAESDWLLIYYAFFIAFFGVSLHGYIKIRNQYKKLYNA